MSFIVKYLRENNKEILILLLVAVAIACLNIGVIISDRMAHHREIELAFNIINELTGAFTAVILVPPLFWFFDRYPLRRPFLWQRLILYMVATLLYGFTFTSIMYLSRVPIYELAGITRLHEIFNNLPYRYLMEYFKQLSTFWSVYFVYWALRQHQTNRTRILRESRLKEELLKAQVQSLQMQLHPHFFFNTLNTISSLMYKDPARADRLIARLSAFLRTVLQLKDKAFHTLNQEINLLQKYTSVMLDRYPDNLLVEYDLEEEVLTYPVPVLLLQPLVENAIQYAMDHGPRTEVSIRASTATGRLDLQIVDNGPGIADGNIAYGTGLNNTLQRLQKLYSSDFDFGLQNEATGGLSVNISLPKPTS